MEYHKCHIPGEKVEVDWSVATILLGGVTGAVGYIGKKFFDLRFEAIARFHADKYNALVQIRGLLSEIDHCILHLSKGHEKYAEEFEPLYKAVRKESRMKSAVLSDELAQQVLDATDIASAYVKSRTEIDKNAWNFQHKALLVVCESLMRTVELHPRTKGRTGV
jgi:hypothetical protein